VLSRRAAQKRTRRTFAEIRAEQDAARQAKTQERANKAVEHRRQIAAQERAHDEEKRAHDKELEPVTSRV
jgi:hypothetical protein